MPHHDPTEFPEPTYQQAVEGWQHAQEHIQSLETALHPFGDAWRKVEREERYRELADKEAGYVTVKGAFTWDDLRRAARDEKERSI